MSRNPHPNDQRAAERTGDHEPVVEELPTEPTADDPHQALTDEPDRVMFEEMEALRRTTFANR